MPEDPKWYEALANDGGPGKSVFYASDYELLSPGSRASFSYEEQEGVPVDGSSRAARDAAPFTLRIIPPSLEDLPASFAGEAARTNVDSYQQAGQSMESNQQAAQGLLEAYGISSQANSAVVANTLNQQISAGQFLNRVSGTQIRTTLTDATTAMDIAAQIAAMASTPPLTLLVNPSSMSISYQGIQSYQERGREGFIFQRWGEQQPTIKFQGQTGAFIAGEISTDTSSTGTFSGSGLANAAIQAFREFGETTTPTGVQFASKRNSAAFQNFQSLYQIYRNNGYIYDRVGQTEAHLAIGAVAIDYDQYTYIGHIESFEYAYDTTQIHAIEWSMEFVVDVMYDNAQTPTAVLPLVAPTPNPTSPGGALGQGARGNAAKGWLSITGTENAPVLTGWAEEFGVSPDNPEEATPPYGETTNALATNPDGTPSLTNPNVGG